MEAAPVPDIEIYTRTWCPYCAKAKTLLRAKNLTWREVDITLDVERQEEMIARAGQRTVPQIFINGDHVGGYDDLARLNATGELDRRLGNTPTTLDKLYDVAVVGGGPAGLTAAMYAARKSLSTLLVAGDVGGQLGTTRDVANYPGCDLILGPDLVQRLFVQTQRYEIHQLIGERVTGVRIDGRTKILDLESGREVRTLTLIIASGVQKRRLGVPGEKEFTGHGVFYCSTCDGPLMQDKTVTIVGGGNSALEAAIELEAIASQVFLVAMEGLTGDGVLQDKVTANPRIHVWNRHTITAIHGSEHIEAVTVADVSSGAEERLRCDGVFIEIGYMPNTDFVLDLLDTNERGEILVDRRCHTGVRGVFAAGDCTDVHDKQIVIAVAEGATAALSAFEYLVTQA